MTRTSILLSAAIVGSAICLAAPVLAEEVVVKHQAIDPNVPHVFVRYGDLDLGSQDGRDSLTDRLDSAVRTVCGNADVRNLDEYAHMRDCRAESTDRAYAARDELFAQQIAARDQGRTLAAAPTLTVLASR